MKYIILMFIMFIMFVGCTELESPSDGLTASYDSLIVSYDSLITSYDVLLALKDENIKTLEETVALKDTFAVLSFTNGYMYGWIDAGNGIYNGDKRIAVFVKEYITN